MRTTNEEQRRAVTGTTGLQVGFAEGALAENMNPNDRERELIRAGVESDGGTHRHDITDGKGRKGVTKLGARAGVHSGEILRWW